MFKNKLSSNKLYINWINIIPINIDNIKENVNWMGWKPWCVTYSSDHFDTLYEFAERLILEDKIIICERYLLPELYKKFGIENIINKNIYPADKQDIKAEDDKSSAMGAMGLKPKIVH